MPSNSLITFKPLRVPASKLPDPTKVEKYLGDALNAFGRDLKKDFEATVTNWQDKPKFVVSFQVTGNKVSYSVYTTSKIYSWVSGGAKKHTLSPKKAKALKLVGTRMATLRLLSWVTVGLIKKPKITTKTFKTAIFVANVKKHPGIKKRDYPKQIMAKRKPEFSPRMHAAIVVALRK